MSSGDESKQMNVEELSESVRILEVNDGNHIDPAVFDRKCRISSDSAANSAPTFGESSIKNEMDIATPEGSDDTLSSRIDKQPKKASIYDQYTHPCLPKINCTEKIIFCIDMSSELEEIPFRKSDGSHHSALSMVKRTIELFVHNKNFIDKKHEYSLMVLYESATWVREFTNDIIEFIDSLEDLNETQACNSCDLGSIVQLISEKFDLSVPVSLVSVPFTVRVILIYGRSNCMFHFSDENLKELLMRHPLLFVDILYIHEPPSIHNRSKEIYDSLCDLDEQNKSYIFEVTRNITKLHNCMAKFLSHSLQRSAQKDSCYKIRIVDQQDIP